MVYLQLWDIWDDEDLEKLFRFFCASVPFLGLEQDSSELAFLMAKLPVFPNLLGSHVALGTAVSLPFFTCSPTTVAAVIGLFETLPTFLQVKGLEICHTCPNALSLTLLCWSGVMACADNPF